MMRKLFVALLVGAVAVGLAAPAFAADLKFTGAYRVRFQFDKALPCFDADDPAVAGTECDGHDFQARFKPRFDVETEGGVKGVIQFEIGDLRYGTTATSGQSATGGMGTDGVNVETKFAYIDFPLPATPFRLMGGLFGVLTPKGIVIDEDFPGLSLYGKLGQADVGFMWLRANNTVSVGAQGEGARDLYHLSAAVSPMRDLNLNGYFIYDHDMESPTGTGKATTGYWVGVGAAGKAQAIRWDLDFVYGSKELDDDVDMKGWALDGGVGMALAGTPLDLELRGWWATGDDGTGTDSDAFPIISAGHEPGTQVWGGGGAIDIDATADNIQNTWGIGVIARYTVSPTLRLTGNLHYIGTQEEGSAAVGPSPAGDGDLSGVDSVGTEIGVKVDYTIARGLVFTLTAGHLMLGDDESVDGTKFDDVTKIAGVLNYGF